MKMIDYSVFNEDCLIGMRELPDKSVDLIVTDPPFLLSGNRGGGFWSKNENANHYNARGTRKGMDRLVDIKDGFGEEYLDEMVRLMKKINIYLFCSQRQLPILYKYFAEERKCNWNLLTWHKTNPIPACGNKYLNDTEYILFFREKGVKIHGSYDTKRTFYTSLRNQRDNERYKHPTCKPVSILSNLIINSSQEGDVVLDPFMGSGSTGEAALTLDRNFLGYEIDRGYYETALERIQKCMSGL